MDKKVITSHQLFTFSALSTLGGSILVISSVITAVAKRDAWLSVLVTMLFGLLMMWIYCFLGTRYHGLTLIGITQKIFGKWLGKIVSVGYLSYLLTTTYGIPHFIGSFVSTALTATPVSLIILPFVAGLVIAVYYGIEAFARASEIFFIFFTVLFLISIILVLPNLNLNYITPVLENGVTPVFKGAVILSGYISIQNITVLMIYPSSVDDYKAGGKAFVKGFLWANTVVFLVILVSILVLGSNIVANSAFPTILLAREINVGTVLTRLEYIISILWVVSEFGIGILYFYSLIKAFSELLGLKDHKKIVAPIGLIVLLYSFIVYPNALQQSNWAITGFTPHVILYGFILPVLMLIVYLVKKQFFNVQ